MAEGRRQGESDSDYNFRTKYPNFDDYLREQTPQEALDRYKWIVEGNRQNSIAPTDRDKRQYTAYKDAINILGRDITPDEWYTILGAYQGPNWEETGKAYLGQMAQYEKTTPAYLAKQAPQYYGSVDEVFKTMMGRDPTASEREHYGTLLASKQIDQYGIEQLLGGTPEALNKKYEAYDTDTYNRWKDETIADFQKRGQAIGSTPALDYALTDLMGKIRTQRSASLAGLSREDYTNQMNQYLGNVTGIRDRALTGMGANMDRGWGGADYLFQKNDYMNYLNSQKRGGSPWGAAVGMGLGAGVGGFFGGPQGAMVGSGVGGAFGNALFD